ncbi:FAD/NAD(P)-binding domain-containing protein [Sistotremastrum suecicum HHB10207 ss-3]|uniref:FAD/NAD(P)-binding domain-containing protein n=1 Tax=Sistotremastrum suecicum HHB10207 ss-3 TaxID=1314776 RepID=A0A165ZYZ2_9AGAM|nr:FAD/NAD(P)-binding domain-containing protein [Sistotremastrum suecicum HHB10207 ss-3]
MLSKSVLELPFKKPRKIKIICIGAGYSGIAFAYKVSRELNDVELIIYEKNAGIGGTWYENRYPGCACDVPSHSYTFSWAGYPKWTKFWASASEILSYLEECVQKWDLLQYIQCNHSVMSAKWDRELSKWKLEILNANTNEMFIDTADVVFNATGSLNRWKWPDINGLNLFRGHVVHSAAWDSSFDFSSKKVLLVGGGPSSVQILPQLQPIVSSLTFHIRSPLYVTRMFGQDCSPEGGIYTQDDIAKFALEPTYLLEHRKKVSATIWGGFDVMRKDSPKQLEARTKVQEDMRRRLEYREDLCRKLIPTWHLGCKRAVPGINFLETLLLPNVRVLSGEILQIKENSVITQEAGEDEYDAIICATGFDTSCKPAFPILGRDGVDLREHWSTSVDNYLSVAVHGFPNYFLGCGPNNPTVLPSIEVAAGYAVQCIRKIQSEGIRSMEATKEAVDDFMAYKRLFMEQMVWTSPCSSWYKGGSRDGDVIGQWVGSPLHYMAALGEPRFEDYHIDYLHGNRFVYLGSGQTLEEVAGTKLAWYVRRI